jgi:putative nucleotidyltransferase with HDIG domain
VSTQSRLLDRLDHATETQGIAYLSLKIEQFQGLQGRFPRIPDLKEHSSWAQFQMTRTNLIPLECKQLYELPVFHELKQEFAGIVIRLSTAMKARDEQLYRHSLRVQSLAISLASALNLPKGEVLRIGLAAFFHDIGKMGINNTILHKASGLTRQEFEIIKGHPGYGAKMLSRFEILRNVVPLVYHHHESWDGMGYPDGLYGEAIPLGARIVAIADAFEAMTSHRSYQHRRTSVQAMEELCESAGTQFDAQLVRLFCKSFETDLVDSFDVQYTGTGFL